MTGYLRALGSMAVGQAPQLRPRPRARFEPADRGGLAVDWPGEVHEELPARPAAPAGWSRGPAASPVVPTVHPPAAAGPPAGPQPVRPPPAGEPRPVPPAQPVPTAVPAAGRRAPADVDTGSIAGPVAPLQSGSTGEPTSAAGAAPGSRRHWASQHGPSPHEVSRHERVVIERVERELAPPDGPRAGGADRPTPAPPASGLARPEAGLPAVRARVAARPPREPEPPAPAPPVIHVSVGRIEVRAVPASIPRPAAPAPTPAAPSLEEYLAGLGSGR